MTILLREFEAWLSEREHEHFEFKEAKQQYDFDKLLHYCVALSNEGGGKLILGVTNRHPRKVVGTQAFPNIEKIKKDIYDNLHVRIDVQELRYDSKRVLVFEVGSRPIGTPIGHKGRYWMRVGESLESMSTDRLKRIFAEAEPDYSAECCDAARIDDLDRRAIKNLRSLWHRKSKNKELLQLSTEKLLESAELFVDGKLTYAALVLLGRQRSLGRLMPNVEIVYEYRTTETSIPSDTRIDMRAGFFAILDEIWNIISQRNDIQHIQEGLFVRDISNFNEEVVREGLLNAVCHRDYRSTGSVFVRHSPNTLLIESPGPFPVGVTAENLLHRQVPRNRRIAEVFQKCGLVERSGQGVDKMFRRSIEEAKPRPDYSDSNDLTVNLKLRSEIQDVHFLRFLERISEERHISWSLPDLLLLDDLRLGKQPLPSVRNALHRLRDQKVIEVIGRGRGTKYILSKQFYTFVGEKGTYTRRKGLGREEKKSLVLRHLQEYAKGYIKDFEQVMPDLRRAQIHTLLKLLKKEGKIEYLGHKRRGFWQLKK